MKQTQHGPQQHQVQTQVTKDNKQDTYETNTTKETVVK